MSETTRREQLIEKLADTMDPENARALVDAAMSEDRPTLTRVPRWEATEYRQQEKDLTQNSREMFYQMELLEELRAELQQVKDDYTLMLDAANRTTVELEQVKDERDELKLRLELIESEPW